MNLEVCVLAARGQQFKEMMASVSNSLLMLVALLRWHEVAVPSREDREQTVIFSVVFTTLWSTFLKKKSAA